MRPLLHLLSLVFVLPGTLLAAAFIILGRAIATQSLLGVFGQLLADALWLVPWGVLGFAAVLLLLAVGGFFALTRPLAGLCVAVLGIGSILVVLTMTISHSNFSWGELPFYVPAVVASGIGLWLGVIEPGKRRAAAVA